MEIICVMCAKSNAFLVTDPFELEVYGIKTRIQLCDECYDKRMDDV